MKLLSICLFAVVLVTFLSGCASDSDSRGYSPGQLRAQHSQYDPSGVVGY
jgi:hypothetical protein